MDEYGVSEAEIARRIGANPQTVNTWRHGEMKQLPRLAYLRGLAELTKTDYSTVLTAALIDTGYIDSPLERGGDYLGLIAGLAVDADDIQSDLDGFIADDDDHESLVSAIEDLLLNVRDFAAAVDGVAARVFIGDEERLKRLKRETKRFRR